MVVALVLASCGPAVPEEEEEEVVTEEEEEEEVMEEEEEEVAADVPKYGGVFTFAYGSGPYTFDEAHMGHRIYARTLFWTNDQTGIGNWARGPAGTGEVTWRYTLFPGQLDYDMLKMEVFESFEMPDPNTHIFHVRKGIHWHDKPPWNGRELDADDVLFTMLRLWNIETSRSHYQNYPWDENLESITAPDKWTIVVKYKPGRSGIVWEIIANHITVVPKEIAELDGTEWGSEYLKDWENSIGTGAFILTDYVDASSVTLERNPNYWDTDPVGPGKGNQLPYIDGIKWLVIPDASTRYAALRTAKIDWEGYVSWEEQEALAQTNPELQYLSSPAGTNTALHLRVDKPELPFDDIRVRHALMLAIDQQAILDDYYGGHATMLSSPVAGIPEYDGIFIPLDQLSETIQELFEYHPDKAKQLLAEAGYPDGFQTTILTTSTSADLLSVVKDYWEDIGVELILDVKESGAFTSLLYKYEYDIVIGSIIATLPFKLQSFTKEIAYSFSRNDDPYIEESYWYMAETYWEPEKRAARLREVIPYILEKSWKVLLPYPVTYTYWQPWVKNYHGELSVAYVDYWNFQKYIWIDQDLKEELTGER
jgi:peptide/nickel transport system substrate-binding protein